MELLKIEESKVNSTMRHISDRMTDTETTLDKQIRKVLTESCDWRGDGSAV